MSATTIPGELLAASAALDTLRGMPPGCALIVDQVLPALDELRGWVQRDIGVPVANVLIYDLYRQLDTAPSLVSRDGALVDLVAPAQHHLARMLGLVLPAALHQLARHDARLLASGQPLPARLAVEAAALETRVVGETAAAILAPDLAAVDRLHISQTIHAGAAELAHLAETAGFEVSPSLVAAFCYPSRSDITRLCVAYLQVAGTLGRKLAIYILNAACGDRQAQAAFVQRFPPPEPPRRAVDPDDPLFGPGGRGGVLA